MISRRRAVLSATAAAVVSGAALALPAAGDVEPRTRLDQTKASHLSQVVSLRLATADPAGAPPALRERAEALHQVAEHARGPAGSRGEHGTAVRGVFNADDVGLPQNEESVNACRSNTRTVLEGTNDFRGLIDPEGNFTGWHLSVDGGGTLANEGLLPPVEIGPVTRPSGGDPVVAIDEDTCDLYMVDLNFDPADPMGNTNGIGVYKSDAVTLASCPGGPDPSCWPTRRAAATAAPPHFLDKPWGDVGESGDAGKVVWVTYSDFLQTGPGELDFTASIFAVRCDADLGSCSDPILISGGDRDVQFSDVTIGEDGRTYVTWSEIQGELEGTAQTFIHKIRVAEPGSTTFGPSHVIATETQPLPFGGFLHANDFRIATYQKNEVAMVNGSPRVFDIWDACRERPLDTVCVEPEIKLAFSDDLGATWSAPQVISRGGDNYFPSISNNRDGSLAAAWYTNRFDPTFHNRQDVELARVDAGRLAVRGFQRLTSPSNETEADPTLGGLFIGDYLEVFAHHGRAWTGFNANCRSVPLFGEGTPLPQQDNYLSVRGF
jgi:hypothetical protein